MSERRFTGWWIPVELREEHEATAIECMLWAEVHALSEREEGCTAGNEHFARHLGVTESRVSQLIAQLRRKGLIRQTAFNGRIRTLQAESPWTCRSQEVGGVAKQSSKKLRGSCAGSCEEAAQEVERQEVPAYKGERKEENQEERIQPPTPLQGDSVPVPVSVPVVRKARRNGSFTPASPEIRSIIQAFAGVYELRFRSRYVPNPKRDTAAALALVTAGLEPIAVAERFNAATTVRGGFWCTKCNALPILAERWNEIGAEIAQVRTSGATVAPGTSESDAAEWARSIRELPEVGA